VHTLLRHLEQAGFSGSPRVVGDGYDDQGREVLTFIEGTFVHPRTWSDEGIWQAGQLLRVLHEATAGLRPSARPGRLSATATRGHGTSWPAMGCRSR
jgi:hypothetical protein